MQPDNVTALARVTPSSMVTGDYFNREQLDLLKRTIAKGTTDDEFKLFLYQCQRTGLDPFSRQIYCIVRKVWNPETKSKEPKATIQTGIDGFRLIAERTKRYAPGPEPTFEYDNGGNLRKATAYVKKQTADGTWHTVAASAFYADYVVEYDGKPQGLWAKPHIMLPKCAEAQALRRAFPAELSGIYTAEEMAQSGNGEAPTTDYIPPPPPTAIAQPLGTEAPRSEALGKDADTGEAPIDEDLDMFADDVKRVKWKSQHLRNWCQKYFSVQTPDGFTKVQLRDAFSMVHAWAKSKEEYGTKVKELQAAGRINPEPPPAPAAEVTT